MVISSLLRRPLPIVVAVAAIASGCGGSSSDSGSSSTGAGAGSSSDAARVKFTQCLRDNGVDIPDTNGGRPDPQALQNIDQTKLQTAMKACQKYQQAAVGDISDAQRQEFQDAFTKFSACMRQHGVDVPDNVGSGGGPPAGAAQIDQNDPKVKAAISACQDKLPQGGALGGGDQ
ncbi:MAG TPA: hypothetical protein VNT55_02995 [Baekduia sp.]|nr:hypothetical protein [Baekduia sp.]